MENTFFEKIRTGIALPDVRTISWKVKGDDKFRPEKCSVVLEASTGEQWELVIHSESWQKNKWKNEEEVILNAVFSYHHIQMSGLWCGITCDISQMVNAMRKKYPHTGIFFVNEEECRKSDFVIPVYRF